jgi:uncharacterized membrane protein
VRTLDETLDLPTYYVLGVMSTPEGERRLLRAIEPFCTSDSRFAIPGRENCERRAFTREMFAPVSTQGRTGLVVDFLPENFGAPRPPEPGFGTPAAAAATTRTPR